MLKKRGISNVITVVILIALVLTIVGIVWAVINNLVKGELGSAESCFGIFEEVNLNSRYTCYNSSQQELLFSICIGDVVVDEALIGVSGQGTGVSFKLSSQAGPINNVVTYPNRSASVRLPSKNSGFTYIFNMAGAGFSGTPDSISIAPIIKGNQCGVSDTLGEIASCASLNL